MNPATLPTDASAAANSRGLLLAVLGAIAFSGKTIIVKLAYRYDVDAVTLIMYRMLFSLPLFIVLAWWAGRGRPPLTRRDIKAVLGLGFCGYYLASFRDFAGLRHISASLERLILYPSPTVVSALGVILFERKVARVQIVALLLSYCGVLCVFGRELDLRGANVPLGAALVFASAVSYAVYLVYSGEEVRRLGASAAAQAGSIGPLSTILLAVLLPGESFTAWTALGTALVLTGIWQLARQPTAAAKPGV